MNSMPSSLDIVKSKSKSGLTMTILVDAQNALKRGRFYMLWRGGNFLTIQAEPWWRPGVENTLCMTHYMEEHRALWHLQEVIQVMLDTIVLDGESNWAYLVRLRDNTYRLVYKRRQLVNNCPIWTKVVELDDIELTRLVSGLCWEGVYEGRDVDIFIGWQDEWGDYISAESRGQKLVQSRGVGHYFFDLKAHVSKNGIIVGIMMEAVTGRPVTPADRPTICEAVADIQRHGIFFAFQVCDIYITERGIRFASASSSKYYRDPDTLAEKATYMWETLANLFNDPLWGFQGASRSLASTSFIIPRLPSPGRPITLTPEEIFIRWVWSILISDDFCRFQTGAFGRLSLHTPYRQSAGHTSARYDRRIKGEKGILLPPDDFSWDDGVETPALRVGSEDGPLAVNRIRVARYPLYAHPMSKPLLLPREPDQVAPAT